MKLSISTTLFYGKHIFDVLPELKGLFFDGLELRLKESHFDYNENREIKELTKKAKKEKIKIISLHAPSSIDISSSDEWDRVRSIREVQKAVVIANRIGAEFIVVHPGEKRYDGDTQFRMLKSSLDEIIDFAKGWEIPVLIENTQPGKIGDNLKEIVKIIDMYDTKYTGTCLDTSHLNLCGMCMGDAIQQLGGCVKEVHVSDNKGKKDDHALPYEGTFDWDDFLHGLKDIQFDQTLCFELMPEDDYIRCVKKIEELYKKWVKALDK